MQVLTEVVMHAIYEPFAKARQPIITHVLSKESSWKHETLEKFGRKERTKRYDGAIVNEYLNLLALSVPPF